MHSHTFFARELRRPLVALAVMGILLMPGGLVTSSTTSADTKLSASDKALLEEQKQYLDPQASVDTETEIKDPAASGLMTLQTQQAMATAPKADAVSATAALTAAQGGRWSRLPSFPANTNAYHMVMGPGGKILLIAGSGNSSAVFKAKTFKAYMWSPTKGITKTIKVPTDMFCSGHTLMLNGQALAAGGTATYSPWKGSTGLYTFDFTREVFTKQRNMNHGRWYPTIVNSPSGNPTIVGGLNAGGRNAGTTEVYNQTTKRSTDLKAVRVFPLYPQIFTTDKNYYFYTGQGWANSAKDTVIHKPGLWNISTNAFTPVPGLTNANQRGQGSSCRIGDARNQDYIVIGGGWPATASTNIINLRTAKPAFRAGPSLASAKAYVSCVQLPDGTLFEVNGGTANKIANASREAAILSSASATRWTQMNPMPTGEHRLYHSTAFLMDDGSVVTFGSNPSGQARSNTVLRYEPPYLFKGSRPTLSSVPAVMNRGKTYTLGVSANVTHVTFTTAPSPTHSTDANQKQVTLPVVDGKVTLNFNGYQFGNAIIRVYALNSQGIPSISKWSKVQ